jgi:hypothetical protein
VRRWLTLTAGIIISAFFAWLGFRNLNFDKLLDTLGQIQVLWLGIAVGVYFVGAYIITWRWHYLLYPVKDVQPNRLFSIVIIGYMGNNIYPARIGEFIRAYILKRNEQVAYVKSLTTILVERIFDGLVMLVFIFSALLFVDFEEPLLRQVIQFTTPLFLGALLIFSFFALRPHFARRVYSSITGKIFPARFQDKVLRLADHFMDSLAALRNPRLLVLTWTASILSWTVEASTYWIVLRAFDFEVSFWVLMLVMGLANLTTILPSTPGYVGTFHGVVVLTLKAFDVNGEDAGAYAIVMHMVLWLPITIAGAVLLWRQGMGWRDLGRASHLKESEVTA